jgi:hypothetical protein
MPLLWRHQLKQEALVCSFCHKSQDAVGKLISSPTDYSRAYICNECILVCSSAMTDEQDRFAGYPLAAQLLEATEQWILRESLGNDASEQLSCVRRLARMMFVKAPSAAD